MLAAQFDNGCRQCARGQREREGVQMIVTVGRVTTDPEKRDELVRIAQAVARASREEEGCIGYRVYEDTERENEFVFVEEWESEEALQSHFGTPHIAEFMRAILGAITGPPDVKFHTVERSVDLAELTANARE
jgi:quinol monooxygenase YgiN